MYYFDADVQVKYFINEPGSAWVRHLTDERDAEGQPLHIVATLEISLVEVSAAIAIIQRVGRIGKQLREQVYENYLNFVAHRLQLLTVDAALVAEASSFAQKYPLKALDALHLAAAVRLNHELATGQLTLTLVTSDHQILTAAKAESLLTEDPVDHSEPDE